MDCSGTIYYLLKTLKVADIPRSSSDMHAWVKQKGALHSVTDSTLDSSQFSKLKPGDLLFWTGTYGHKSHQHVSHVMIYLGKNLEKKALMFGSSNGRTYQHKKCGV